MQAVTMQVLEGAVAVAAAVSGSRQGRNSYMCDGQSVLVHCSDGWDRTSQLVSIAQVMALYRHRRRHAHTRAMDMPSAMADVELFLE